MTQPQPQPSLPAPEAPFNAMLRGAAIPTICAAPVIVLAFWITRQTRGGLASLLGVSITIVFFASGLYILKRVTNGNPNMVVAGALAVYLGQIMFLGLVILILSGAEWLDGQAFGLSVLAVALIWQLFQVLAFMRMRKPVYDDPGPEPVA